jgi:hypothetical protein
MGLCLSAAALTATLVVDAFTLAWTHSIEKIRWEEDWRIEGDFLHLVGARIRGSGAGMEIPPGAVLRDGVWHYVPVTPPLPRLMLAHSPYAAGYQICFAGDCAALADLLPGLPAQATLELSACPADRE